jgi:hypothetical protein
MRISLGRCAETAGGILDHLTALHQGITYADMRDARLQSQVRQQQSLASSAQGHATVQV